MKTKHTTYKIIVTNQPTFMQRRTKIFILKNEQTRYEVVNIQCETWLYNTQHTIHT